jgi:hypothetical protein
MNEAIPSNQYLDGASMILKPVLPFPHVESLDIAARIEELKLLKRGWLDGKGLPPAHDGLVWLAAAFAHFYPADLPSPYLFPTAEGRVLAEWSLRPWSPSVEIDLASKRGEWHALNLDTDAEVTKELVLDDSETWKWLAEQISAMRGEVE